MATFAGSRVGPTAERGWGLAGLRLETIVGWLLVAVAVELVVLRTLTRIAIHVPGLGAVAGPYELLAGAGRFAYYAATVVALVAAAMLVSAAWRAGSVGGRLIAAGVVLLGFAAAALRAGPGLGEAAALNTLLLGSLVLIGLGAALLHRGGPAVAIVSATTAVALSGTFSVSQMWAAEGLGNGGPSIMLDLAEWSAIAFALALPWFLGGMASRDRRPVIAGAVTAVVVFALLIGNPSTTRFLLLWTHGLTGSLPAVAYAAAAGALAATVVALYQRQLPLAAGGLLLLVAGGIAMQNTYQSMLVGLGLACIGLAHGFRPTDALSALRSIAVARA